MDTTTLEVDIWLPTRWGNIMGYYNSGTAAGSGLAATGAAAAVNYLWIGAALLTVGFAIIAVTKLLPRRSR